MTPLHLRPSIKTIEKNPVQSEEELFQNEILRPILKLQHDLICSFFNNYIAEKKLDFTKQNVLKKTEIIDRIFSQDNTFKIELKGMIIGLLTLEEYSIYLPLKKDLNKRIYTMLKERISSTLIEIGEKSR